MATIDELVVKVTMDNVGLKQGQRDIQTGLKKTQDQVGFVSKDMEARGKQAGMFFSNIKNQVLGMTAAFVGLDALKNIAVNIVNADAAVGRLAGNLGVATEHLSAWEHFSEKFGSSAGEVDTLFKSVSKT